jgi:hypothetical protein
LGQEEDAAVSTILDAAVDAVALDCTEDGWCMEVAGQTGKPSLQAIHGSSPTDVWAIGYDGIIMHRGPTGWAPVDSGLTVRLKGVWASSANDAWIVGDGGTILRWNGSTWSAVNSGVSTNLNAVWGNSSNDVWFAGSSGVILRWNGTSIAPFTPAHPESRLLWTGWNDGAEVWVGGLGAGLWHFDGLAWAEVPTPETDYWTISGSSASDVWALGYDVMHWDGAMWSIVASEIDFFDSVGEAMWIESPGNAWMVGPRGYGGHLSGGQWVREDMGNQQYLWGVWGSGGALWAVGDDGEIVYRP